MKSIKCELKYCEGCGTLQLRPVKSVTNHCAICQRMLARFRFPRAALAEAGGGLPHRGFGGHDSTYRVLHRAGRGVAMNPVLFCPRKLGFGTAGRSRAREMSGYDGARSDVLFFRAQTLAIIRHFFEIASQIGRLPSILGREFFRAKVSHHAIPSFEDQAVFVHDVERALAGLNEQDGEMVALVGLFHYSLDDVAAMLGRSRSFVAQHFADAIDQLAEVFLRTGLLRENRPDRRPQYFEARQPRNSPTEIPPKKPVASVTVEEFREVDGTGAKYSFDARLHKAWP